jgi:cytidylate kinase
MIITIDGPSGSGKSTLALALSRQLNFFCLNSGYLYRGLAYVLKNFYSYDEKMLENPLPQDIQACFESGVFEYRYESGLAKIYWIDEITQFLKDPEMARGAVLLAQSDVARGAIKDFQIKLMKSNDVVVEGRSCGSTMFPEAQVKFYLDADPRVRAWRFVKDQEKRGNHFSFDNALEVIKSRDLMDTQRTIDPLVVPKGAFILSSSTDDQDQVLHKALNYVKEVMHKKN